MAIYATKKQLKEGKEVHERFVETTGHFSFTHISGWTCPKCGAVYSPMVKECSRCNQGVDETCSKG
jgi:uncharacterized OB-fold protein